MAPDAPYDKQIVDIQLQNDIAVVTAKVLVGDDYCIDYISVIDIDGAWKIRHKIFTNNLN